MTIAFVRAGTGNGSSTNIGATMAVAPAQNNLLVAIVQSENTGTQTAAAGWTKLTQVTSTDVGAMYWKVAGAGESTGQSVCTVASTQWSCVIAEYSGTATSLPVDVESAQADNDSPKTTPAVDPVDGVERLVVGAAMSSISGLFSVEQVNGSTTGVSERGDIAAPSSKGQCCLYDLIEATTTGGTYTGQANSGGGAAGSAHIAIFKPAAGAATKAPPPWQRRWRYQTRRRIS